MHRFWLHTNPFRLVDQATGKTLAGPVTVTMDGDETLSVDGVLQAGQVHSWVEAPGYGRVEAYVVFA